MPKEGDRFVLAPGDGYCPFVDAPIVLQLTTAPWFKPKIWQWYGEGILFTVVEGPNAGEYVALTPRTLGSLAEALDTEGWKSVVVHRVRNQTDSFGNNDSDTDACGMSFVETFAYFEKHEGKI